MGRKKTLQEIVTTGGFTLTVVILIVSVLWLVGAFSSITESSGSDIWHRLLDVVKGTLLRDIIGYTMLCVATLQMMLLNNTFALIRTHTTFHLSLFFLSAGLLSSQTLDVTSVLVPFMLLSMQNLFHTYQRPESAGYAYQCFLFLSLGSLFFPPMVYFIPLFLGAMINYLALTPRTFMSSLFGLLTPYWLLFAYAFCADKLDIFAMLWEKLIPVMPDYSVLSLVDKLSLAFVWLITLAGIIDCVCNNFHDKIRTRYHLGFLILLQLWTSALIIVQPVDYPALFPLLFIGGSILGAHLFTLSRGRWNNLFFILCALLFIALIGFKLWTQLSNF